MNLSDDQFAMIYIALALVLAALGGFAIGIVLTEKRHKIDEAFNPAFRPDQRHERI